MPPLRPVSTVPLALALAIAGGCTQSDDADTTAAADESSGAADSSSGDASTGDLDAMYDCVDPMFTTLGPLVGPGYDEAMGGLLEPKVESYLISTTIALPYPEKVEDFLEVSTGVQTAIEASEVVAWQLAFEPTCGFFRTMTVWRDPGDMVAFVGTPAHAEAIARSNELVLTGKVTHWPLPADQFPPTWDMARAELVDVSPFGGGY